MCQYCLWVARFRLGTQSLLLKLHWCLAYSLHQARTIEWNRIFQPVSLWGAPFITALMQFETNGNSFAYILIQILDREVLWIPCSGAEWLLLLDQNSWNCSKKHSLKHIAQFRAVNHGRGVVVVWPRVSGSRGARSSSWLRPHKHLSIYQMLPLAVPKSAET